MSKLVISCIRGGRRGARFELDQDVVTVGRRPESDIAFEAAIDRKASAAHAELRRSGHRWIIRDLGSTNGTFVGGLRIDEAAELTDGCNVEFGKDGPVLHIRIVAGVPELSDASDCAATQLADLPDVTTGPGAVGPSAAYPQSTGRTGIYRAMMVEAVSRSSRKLKVMIAILAFLLVGGAVAAGFYIFVQSRDMEEQKKKTDDLRAEATLLRKDAEALRRDAEAIREDAEAAQREQERLQNKTTALETKLKTTEDALTDARDGLTKTSGRLSELRAELSAAEGDAKQKLEVQAKDLEAAKKKYEAQLSAQEEELRRLRSTEDAAEVIAQTYERTLFMLIAQTPQGPVGFCTAFAISTKGLLVTNAHCVAAINQMNAQGLPVLARMNRDPSRTYQVVRWKSHPDYKNSAFSADVALLKADLKGAALPVAARLADDETARKLRTGQAIFTMGFPGKVMNEARPAADFRAAVVSRITDYQNSPASDAESRVVWHSALTSKGTSGSPIFNVAGEVVAVNNGGLSARKVYERDVRTGQVKESFAYDATGLNFGIRVDTVREMLK